MNKRVTNAADVIMIGRSHSLRLPETRVEEGRLEDVTLSVSCAVRMNKNEKTLRSTVNCETQKR